MSMRRTAIPAAASSDSTKRSKRALREVADGLPEIVTAYVILPCHRLAVCVLARWP